MDINPLSLRKVMPKRWFKSKRYVTLTRKLSVVIDNQPMDIIAEYERTFYTARSENGNYVRLAALANTLHRNPQWQIRRTMNGQKNLDPYLSIPGTTLQLVLTTGDLVEINAIDAERQAIESTRFTLDHDKFCGDPELDIMTLKEVKTITGFGTRRFDGSGSIQISKFILSVIPRDPNNEAKALKARLKTLGFEEKLAAHSQVHFSIKGNDDILVSEAQIDDPASPLDIDGCTAQVLDEVELLYQEAGRPMRRYNW